MSSANEVMLHAERERERGEIEGRAGQVAVSSKERQRERAKERESKREKRQAKKCALYNR